jgi:ribulose-5-phosphate 4-epimerase/fuculose-1-phosphate aldolase
MTELEKKIEDAIWVAKELFERGKATGSSANLSFKHDGCIYITGSGTCFGRLTPESFSKVDETGAWEGKKPSKELPLHKIYYEKSENIKAVIHTHSFYSVMYTFLQHSQTKDIVPDHTPYLKMKVGTIGLVPYAAPGSEELFSCFKKAVPYSDAFLLAQHGSVVGGKTIMDAFFGIEELEESCKIAWTLRKNKIL